MKIELEIQDKHDLNILWQIINNAQHSAIDKICHMTFMDKEIFSKFPQWINESIIEDIRLNRIKKQLEEMFDETTTKQV